LYEPSQLFIFSVRNFVIELYKEHKAQAAFKTAEAFISKHLVFYFPNMGGT